MYPSHGGNMRLLGVSLLPSTLSRFPTVVSVRSPRPPSKVTMSYCDLAANKKWRQVQAGSQIAGGRDVAIHIPIVGVTSMGAWAGFCCPECC